ncbi:MULTISPECIES: DUF3349 domain-containing protein [Microbacterium]|uniref:DUF3349 domain-containing protein n=1 Tax=Microbacterium TaxID=33882 RepID=UPI001E3763F5|nr:DUF3349 domain-containing protein [Microbacterium nymphoidis]MCD2500093.1 DUF3349 domain-containing protein [Microbacterium nymphoidis]
MSTGLLSQVLGWLRAGYPEGVPPKDYTPLLALLRRTLSNEEFAEVLVALERADQDPVRLSHIREAITRVTREEAAEDDVRTVAARLAAAGWPLSNGAMREAAAAAAPEPDRDEGILTQVLRWLSAGYPQGVPPVDRIPVLALLRPRLTDMEIQMVCDVLIAQAAPGEQLSAVDAQVLLSKSLHELPSAEDIDRVRARLDAVGWSLV